MKAPVTRFAPSPTGLLHIGGARTALFNWLYARGRDGTFLLRIEDTDRARSTPENTEAILDGLRWLGIDWDGEAISQFERADRHAEVARGLVERGGAYRCFSTQEEIEAFRETARSEGRSTLFRSPWRDVPEDKKPDGPNVIRLRAPQEGETVVADAVQGDVRTANDQIDDMVLQRADGTPTYMLAVVVDDHDMGVTHVIRGDDHLTNAARQTLLYRALGWEVPVWAHIPLIHGPDGKKLSKRHGAVGAQEFRAQGVPAAALRNYLARLGWSHRDDEVFTDAQAMEWFDLDGIGRAPARLDEKKLTSISGAHMEMMDDATLLHGIDAYRSAVGAPPIEGVRRDALATALPYVRGAKTYGELVDKAHFALGSRPFAPDDKAAKSLTSDAQEMFADLTPHLRKVSWTREALEAELSTFAEARGTKFGKLAAPLRAALAGRAVTPSVFDMMIVLGRDETIARLEDAAGRSA